MQASTVQTKMDEMAIMRAEAEEKNAGICDYIVSGEDAQKAAQELITDLLKKGKKR